MKLRFKALIIALLIFNITKGQDNNPIPLHQLDSCVFLKNMDQLEKHLSEYGFNFVGASKSLYHAVMNDMFSFDKKSEGVEEVIQIYKTPNPVDPVDFKYKVVYSCMFNRNYNNYKEVLLMETAIKFKNEQKNGDCFHRFYEGYIVDYDFGLCKTKYENNPLYILTIYFNNYAGALKQSLK